MLQITDQNWRQETFDNLEKALRYHDWHYQMSDDHSVYLQGVAKQAAIKNMLAEAGAIDEERTFNLYCANSPFCCLERKRNNRCPDVCVKAMRAQQ